MNVPGINTSSAATAHTDAQIKQLEMISTRSRNGKMKDKEMRDVANQFETMIFRMLVKEMRKTVPENKLMGNDHSMKMYREISDDYMVDELTASNDLGIESVIYNELYENNKNIVDPTEMEEIKPGFIPLKKGTMQVDETKKDDFIPLPQPHTDMIEIHPPAKWVDVPLNQHGFVPIQQKHFVPSNKIDNSR